MRTTAIVFLLVAGACGGGTSPVPLPPGDGGGGGASSSGGGAEGGGGGCEGDAPRCACGRPICQDGKWGCSADACADPCTTLLGQIEEMEKQLRGCCATCKSVQCTSVAKGVCCDITTNGQDTTAFDEAVKRYKNACTVQCPPSPCAKAPSEICVPNGGASRGYCQ